MQRLHCPTFTCRCKDGQGNAAKDSSWDDDLGVDTRMQAAKSSRARQGLGETAGPGKGELPRAGWYHLLKDCPHTREQGEPL